MYQYALVITPYFSTHHLRTNSNPRIVVIPPTDNKQVPCIYEIAEESEDDSWSTISSTDNSGRFGVIEKDSKHMRRHAPSKLHERCKDLREYSREYHTSPRNALEIGYTHHTHLSETSSFRSFLHVSKQKNFRVK